MALVLIEANSELQSAAVPCLVDSRTIMAPRALVANLGSGRVGMNTIYADTRSLYFSLKGYTFRVGPLFSPKNVKQVCIERI